jgi:N-acetylglucosaminyl-diphospho-decaprenol L-rhamnosyltransferase
MAEIGIIIVTYNSAAEIGRCLDAAIPTGADIVVVDNASSDSTCDEVKRRNVCLIANPTNLGFAAAVNTGFTVLNCTYVLLLNPDAVIQTSLEPLRAACDLPRTAGAGGLLKGLDGNPQSGFVVRSLPTPAALTLEALVLNRVWPGNPVNRHYRNLGRDYAVQSEAEQPAGAFLMVRKAVWLELGGLDERFFPLWFEDVDFCRRIRDRGYRLYYVPEAVAIHTGGHSIPRLPLELRNFYWYRSLLRYSAKHFRPAAYRVVCAAVVTGSVLRSIAECLRRLSWRPLAAHARVVWFAGRGLLFGSPG